jgi:hypothetical protein
MGTTVILILVAIVLMFAMLAVAHGLRGAPSQRADAVDNDATKHAESEGRGGHGHGCC